MLIVVLIAGLLSIPVLVLFVEVIGGLRSLEKAPEQFAVPQTMGRVAVIVPAHNESEGIGPTLQDILPQLGPGDRLLVVADNCTDDTASVAADAGAEVIVRQDPQRIGKGYAMARAIEHLAKGPPNLVLFIDADCRVEADVVAKLRNVCQLTGRPVQALYLMKKGEAAQVNHSLSEFAWTLKNFVRPLGLWFFRRPVQLMGTGMIFPWDAIRLAPLASGNLVEDMRLGLDLAAAGKPACFFPFAKVTSCFPTTAKGRDSQRQRWIQGHIATIVKSVPKLVTLAIYRRDLDLLVLALDLLVPPLSLLGLLSAGMLGLTLLLALFGLSQLPLVIASANLVVFTAAVVLAWRGFGRDILPASIGLSVGGMILQKLGVYGQLLRGRIAGEWVRTDRSKLN
jgi:cellulose synthase/poly-beta-1,6-N-acetylglucosamine synthase-like glycosyltransferase